MTDLSKGPTLNIINQDSLYQRFTDWEKKINRCLKTLLNKEEGEAQAEYILMWAGDAVAAYIEKKLTDKPDGTAYTPKWVLDQLRALCQPQSTTLSAVRDFISIKQGTLTIDQYHSKILELVSECGWKDCKECNMKPNLIRDVMALGLTEKKVFRKCVDKGDKLTLEKVISEARTEEKGRAQAAQVYGSGSATVHKQTTKPYNNFGKGKGKPQVAKNGSTQPNSASGGTSAPNKKNMCYGCGETPWHSKDICSAKDKVCYKCQKTGHLASICITSKKKVKKIEWDAVQTEQHTLPMANNKQLLVRYQPVQLPQQPPVHTDSGAFVYTYQNGADSGIPQSPPVQYTLTDSGTVGPPPARLKKLCTWKQQCQTQATAEQTGVTPVSGVTNIAPVSGVTVISGVTATLPEIKIYRIGHPKRDRSHIRPAWYGLFQNKVFAAECEVDTGADCNVMPVAQAREYFGNVEMGPPNVSISAFGDRPVHNLGSIILYLHIGKKSVPVECELCDVDGPLLLGRVDSLKLGYVTFPELVRPEFTRAVKTIQAPKTLNKQTGVTEVSGVTNVTIDSHAKLSGVTDVTTDSHVKQQTVGQDTINSARALDPRWSQPRKSSAQPQQQPRAVVVSRPSHNTVIIDGTSYQVPTTKEFILHEYKDVFDGIGRLPGPKYHIQLKEGYEAVQHRSRVVPHALRQAYKEQLDKLVQDGIITPVTEYTEWVNSIVPVTKSDGSLRLCLDPKDLNKALKRTPHHARTVDEILPELANCKFFTLCDAASAYWHMELDFESSLLTTFNTPWGRFRWKRLPFGLTVSSDAFQERLDPVLAIIPGCTGIADDVLVASRTEADHDAAVLQLLQTARVNGIKFSSKKMQYKSTTVKFFGHLVTADGLKPDPDKIKAITEMRRPNTVMELQSFMGMVNYLHRFSSRLTKLAAPLRDLNKKDSIYDWQPEHQRAFEAIKGEIVGMPVLAYFDADKAIHVQTDASKLGLGAVLIQVGKPVAYASRSLSTHEKNYSNIEREFLAVKFACQKFHHYIWNYDVLIQTDHLPLVSIWKKGISETTERLKNIHYSVASYKLDIQYIKGKDNVIADALSRVSPQHDPDAESDPDVHIRVHQLTAFVNASPGKLDEYREATAADETLRMLRLTVHNGWPAYYKSLKPEIRHFWAYRSDISLEDGLLYKGHALIVPASLRSNTLEALHEGHWGKDKTTLRARDCVYWPNICNDIAEFVRDCDICATYGNAQKKEPIQQHDLPGHPWQKVAVDLFQFEQQNYLLLADYYSRVPFYRKTGMTATAVIQHMKSIFSEHGVPDEVMSDNGPQFDSQEFQSFARSYSFKHITSSPRYPQSNGFIERMVQTVKKCLTKATEAGDDPYKAMLVYRTTPLDSRIPSPAELLYNRRVRSTVLPPHCNKTSGSADQDIRERMLDRQLNSQSQYDNRAGQTQDQLQVQQPVYMKLKPDDKHWTKATVVGQETTDQPRSYVVTTETGASFRRNRSHLKARAAKNTEMRSVEKSDTPDFEPRVTRSATALARQNPTDSMVPEVPPEITDSVTVAEPVPTTVVTSGRPNRDVQPPVRLIEQM